MRNVNLCLLALLLAAVVPALAQVPGATVNIPGNEQPRSGPGQGLGLDRDDKTTWSGHPTPGGARGWRAILLADVDGDGRDDLCGSYGLANNQRAYGCVLNHPGRAFVGNLLQAVAFNGAVDPTIHPTIRVIDLLGNGQRHLCGRTMAGITCQRFTGEGFASPVLVHSMFSDANYWNQLPYASTIAFPKIAGQTAICGRGVSGVMCYRRAGSSFNTTPTWATAFADQHGWGGHSYYSTLHYADINGDGHADVCGRGTAGILCQTYNYLSGTFMAPMWLTSLFSDTNGWHAQRYYASVRVADISNDGRADFCGRGYAGLHCGTSAIPAGSLPGAYPGLAGMNDIAQPEMNDGANWGNPAGNLASLLFADYDGDGKNDVCGLYTPTGGGSSSYFCSRSTSVATAPQFGPLLTRTKSIVVAGAVVAGRLYDTLPRTGFCWTSTDNTVSCSVQWTP